MYIYYILTIFRSPYLHTKTVTRPKQFDDLWAH